MSGCRGAGETSRPSSRLDAAAFKGGLEDVAAEVDVPARDARLKLGGGAVSVVPSRDGTVVDAAALARAVTAAVTAGKAYSGPVPMKAVAPQVTTAEARARAGAADLYLSRPVTLRYRDKEVVLTPELMAGMLSVNKGSSADDYPLTFRNAEARAVAPPALPFRRDAAARRAHRRARRRLDHRRAEPRG